MSAHRTRTCAAALFACAAWVLDAQDARVDFAKVREAAGADIASGAMPGLAVAIVHDGHVVFAEGFGVANVEHPAAPPTPDTVFQVGSAGKMLTAAAVLETSAAGNLPLDDPIARLVSGIDPAIGAATPHQLLAQISGMRDLPGNYGELGDDAHGRFLRTLTAADRILAPGQTFSYSNVGYSLAGLAAAEASGSTFGELIAARVFKPLGMTRTSVRPTEAMTWPLAMGHTRASDNTFSVVRPMAHDTRLWPAGYVFSTANDMARFAIAMLDGGRIDGRAVLRPETSAQMLTGHVALPNLFDGGRYGYGFMLIPMRGVGVAEHAGSMVGFAALVRLVPAHRFAVIALANGEIPAVRTVEAAMETLLLVTPAAPLTTDGPVQEVSTDEMGQYVGRYENRGHFVLTIENGALVLRHNDGPPLRVTKVGPNRFVAAGPNNRPRLRFLLGPAGTGRPAYLHFALWGYRKVRPVPSGE